MQIEALQMREAKGQDPRGSAPASTSTPVSAGPATAGGKNLPHGMTVPADDVHRAAELIDHFLREAGRELSFSVDTVTGRMVVSVRDPATGELIRQLPSEEALRIAHTLEGARTALVDERA
jgi:flagellar protein FlaG